MLGSNFLKNNLTLLSIFILKSKIGLKFFLTKNSRIRSCKSPATETAYDNVKTWGALNDFEKSKEPISLYSNHFNREGYKFAADQIALFISDK